MASFPTTVKSFATRANDQKIDPSHVNDLQDEVNALEDGYLNATARLNSSNSTVANLSVTGGSTFAGAATFSSLATFSTKVAPASTTVMLGDSTTGFKELHCSSAYVNGQPVGVLAGARVSINSSHTPGFNDGWTAISWNTQEYDSASLHSTSANSSRITLTSSGVWAFGGQVVWLVDSLTNSTGRFSVRVQANDTNALACQTFYLSPPSTMRLAQSVSGIYRATSTTDYLIWQAGVSQAGGGTVQISSGTSTSVWGYTHFWVQKVSN